MMGMECTFHYLFLWMTSAVGVGFSIFRCGLLWPFCGLCFGSGYVFFGIRNSEI